ncbi:MAG: glycoside hydrolase family 65 protein [Microscillaceae bacterium]
MKDYIQKDEWCIIEEGFNPEHNRISESLFSIGNGHQGQRANFEEHYSGDTLPGTYLAGVYYPDKTRVGWWKNGYPEYFAKVLNAPNWIGLDLRVEGETLDLAKCKVSNFRRVLNMKEGYLQRNFTARLYNGKALQIESQRFVSMQRREIGALRYAIHVPNFAGALQISAYLDADVKNEDANYDEKFWLSEGEEIQGNEGYLSSRTKKTGFLVHTGMICKIFHNGREITPEFQTEQREKYVATTVRLQVSPNDEIVIYKYVANLTSRDHAEADLHQACLQVLHQASQLGFEALKKEQAEAWADIWSHSDIRIEGDVAAQQGIRFNIFQLNQTYTGEDERLNIGPKGFTGEKYGGSTYWDTEAYCLAFYLSTADPKVARNLVRYRYAHLEKAIENARKLGFHSGAALYPMVTMNGEECHNEWEITFEEIHRNGAIARAIYDYLNYTGDDTYLEDYGLEVLIAIARFWAQRVNFSEERQQYVILGVTGPNEYENNVNNNWYTNRIAQWCLRYAQASVEVVKTKAPEKWKALSEKISFLEHAETSQWQKIADRLYFPEDPKRGIFLQQDNYLDKEQILVKDLPREQTPLNQKWSWDRILRSCFIKQADTLQGLYLFEDEYDMDTIRRNFDFYEARTVHESSLSPCVHSILAAKLGLHEKAYEMYLRTSRLDLDDYNNDTEDGLHITSMAGTWMSIVQGFGGMRVREGVLHLQPYIPMHWQSYTFKIIFKGALLNVEVSQEKIRIENKSQTPIRFYLHEQIQALAGKQVLEMGLALG